jgi:hypothetical protein
MGKENIFDPTQFPHQRREYETRTRITKKEI